IPMRHDSLGAPYQLESAGMFEITANKDGKPVQIKPDLPLTVDLASRNAENRFNQYVLDTVSANWRYLGADPPQPVEHAAAALLQNPAPATPVSPSADSLDRHYASLVQKLPVPAQPAAPVKHRAGRPTFVLDSDPAEFPELAAFSNVE